MRYNRQEKKLTKDFKWKFLFLPRDCRICRDTIFLEKVRTYWSNALKEYFRVVCQKCGEHPEIGD